MPSMLMRKTRNYDRTGNLMHLKDMFCVHSDGYKDRNCAINMTLPRLTELNCQVTTPRLNWPIIQLVTNPSASIVVQRMELLRGMGFIPSAVACVTESSG